MKIAVVGIGGMLPGGVDLADFWANIRAGRDCAREVPPYRWPIDPASVLQSGGPAPDKVYSLRGYFLDREPQDPNVDAALDPLFHLAVAVSRMAWADAVTEEIDRRRVGVVLGSIALPTERISALSREVLAPLFRGEQAAERTVDPRNVEVVGRPAALVAEILGLGGLHLTLDAACASSLYALKIACDELTSGRADAMLAGGLNRSDSLYTQMGFAQLKALSPSGRCSPFDARADGLLVGEGGAVFVLKRISDAESAGDRIYGIITGIGVSNDVGGSLLAPSSEGQLRAMRSAYRQAGWRPGDVDFIECHATGTPVGDAVELASLQELWREENGRCVLGAAKSSVGHLLTGAGAVSLLKLLLALKNETLPPTANFREPALGSPLASGIFDVLTVAQPWKQRDETAPRRAAINAFGFGGVNAHVLIEEYSAASRATHDRPQSQAARPIPIAVVGIGAHFGPWKDREAFAQRVCGNDQSAGNSWLVNEVTLPLDRVRTPPSELQACLPQQLLLLRVAAEALDDAGGIGEPKATGAYIGIALDPNTTNYDFRWSQESENRDEAGPALTADRVMGSLGSIAASRLARAFDFGGPSFTVSAGEESGLVALRLAVEALQRGELRQALVGAVDLPGDPRSQVGTDFCEGAAALVLMTLQEAESTGRPICAVIDDFTGPAIAVDAADEIGNAGAAAAMASVVKACLVTRNDTCPTVVRVGDLSVTLTSSGQKTAANLERRVLGRSLTISVQRLPFAARRPTSATSLPSIDPQVDSSRGVMATLGAIAEAHETFLRFTEATNRQMTATLALQSAVLERIVTQPGTPALFPSKPNDSVFLERAGCIEFAVGRIEPVLGPEYAQIDAYPTRVRLPDEPLMLVDRIVSIEGAPKSLSRGRIVTEHDVHADRWYLDNGVAPPSIAIESGQADLFLAAWLGADFHTKGHAVYRLLDAAVTFHSELPRPGETVRYDIRIKEFFRQGDTLLFRFEFDGTINGRPLLTMRDGCAGFFTPAELAAGQGVVRTEFQLRPKHGKIPDQWETPAQVTSVESYSDDQLEALRQGDLRAIGVSSPISAPLTLPLEPKLRLIHRVTHFDPKGGRFGLGLIRGEADIDPHGWFLACHFVDDQVMPGTLMYECCLHTLRIAMLRFGFVGDERTVTYEPVIGVTSRLKCRGQVTGETKTVAYEVSIKELGDDPEPFAIAEALMYADGKAIVDVQDMTLRMKGYTKTVSRSLDSRQRQTVFTREKVLQFAAGSPSRAFGERYTPFDRDRFIARLPAPPYSFLDRIESATVEPWVMKAGGSAMAEYDVPAGAWYFAAARQPRMPFTVLLEVALQACGWVSAYIGSALHSDDDLHYRNLGGSATALRAVGPDAGCLTTTVKLTKVSKSGGMIIQHFDFVVRDSSGHDVYMGDTYFGFFTGDALNQQVGLREAQPFQPGKDGETHGERFDYPTDSPFPDSMLRMIDRIDLWLPHGEPHGLGFIRGSKNVVRDEWFFQAHFLGDPVWPGSLGLEAFLQLLQVAAARRWGESAAWESPQLGATHHWTYRGQVTPNDCCVTVQAEITTIDEAAHSLTADGWLLVDGRVIYQMKDFAFRHTK
jgi:3-oxoacyl-(acyl-carrier-protein) synthase/3-hydroxymyristoyl/3-hydroxydecanoyl-(acyl carrier protein) dehydratase